MVKKSRKSQFAADKMQRISNATCQVIHNNVRQLQTRLAATHISLAKLQE